MRLLKPHWVTHDDLPIFSVDIHPDGSRFATGGQGEDSGRVVIWNMAPVISHKSEMDENVPKMLCQIDNHLACVNCVRWSASGKFLASGGDDKLVMVWKIGSYSSGSTVFGGGGKVNVESWRCVSTLRGHGGDVLDLAWSPHDAWLATCSVDNTVIIWNALNLPEMVAVLKGHSGMVKGLAWDPVGKFVASQSDDKTLRIWRTADWKEDTVISEPFEECGGTTHVLRLSWSPDGQYLVSAHAMNGGGPTAQIVEREGWRQDKDFVGHRKAVTCVVSFLALLYRTSKDYSEICCGSYGLMKGCAFQMTLHERMYGKSLAMYWQGGVGGGIGGPATTIVENPELLSLKEEAEKKAANDAASTPVSSGPTETGSERPTVVPPKGPINKQIETRTSDGKRRITPMYIPDAGDQPQPFGASNSQQPTFSSSSEPKSRIVIEKRDDVIVQPNISNSSQHSSNTCLNIISTNATLQSGGNSRGLTGGVVQTEEKAIKVVNGAHDGATAVEEKVQGAEEQVKEISTPVTTHPRPERSSMFSVDGEKPVNRLAVKRKASDAQDRSSTTPATAPGSARRGDVEGKDASVQKLARVSTGHHLPGISSSHTPAPMMADSGIFLSPMRLAKSCLLQISGTSRYLEVENGSGAHTVRFKERSGDGYKVLWETALGGSRVAGAIVGPKVAAVVMEDGILHVFECGSGVSLSGMGGGRPFPPLVLPAPAARLSVTGNFLMAVTSKGGVSVWDISKSKVVIADESMMPIMRADSGQKVTILSCTLTQNGCPVVSLSTRKAFMYSVELGSWLLLGNAGDPIQQSSSHINFVRSVERESSSLPLHSVQSSQQSGRLVQCLPSSSSAMGPSTCILSFMELQLASCKALQSASEYRLWLLAMARFLAQEGLEWKLRLICDDLMGPAHKYASLSKSWESHILGLSKHSLLREVLAVIGSNLRLQRLYIEYSDQMEAIEQVPTARKQLGGKTELSQGSNNNAKGHTNSSNGAG
ncbi:hypothetical protein J437_LFUL014701 [Ladona fulva]|uniref:Protein HIRA n=1 Tax=Ladona fulva TaxID=123851 RepID=A0A8K0KHX4_LADFU|nr:hypothetical protein J437_LFUL014701 [Ladona fulva]